MIKIEHIASGLVILFYAEQMNRKMIIRIISRYRYGEKNNMMGIVQEGKQRFIFSFQDPITMKEVRKQIYQDCDSQDQQSLTTQLAYLALNNHEFARYLLDAKYTHADHSGGGSESLAK